MLATSDQRLATDVKAFLDSIYRRLHQYYGPQHWWPADTPFEVMVGAILTQGTAWRNVERALVNLKHERVLNAERLGKVPPRRLARLIRPAGYFNVKARRLHHFLDYFRRLHGLKIISMQKASLHNLRSELLSVSGIGKETADSILLYSLNKPIFVVDAYTRRILSRHHAVHPDAGYDTIQNLFHRNVKRRTALYNEFHALFVHLGKDYCRKMPDCRSCPLNYLNNDPLTRYEGPKMQSLVAGR
ncbi:MAG: endonuclease III domain-containing protein [Candidatus Omnitrophica bacterium]|nr:endonuclease III domain-containing protein [Candidatus Omnitrophota bacterium]